MRLQCREEEPSQAPSEDVMDDLMTALGSCTATPVYHAATRPCAVWWGGGILQ